MHIFIQYSIFISGESVNPGKINNVTKKEIQELWELLECAQSHYGDALAHLLLKMAMRSALLEGVFQGMAGLPANNRATTVDPAQFDIDRNVERWWSSICISRHYADPPLAFYCFEKALETVYQKGLQAVDARKWGAG